MKAIIQVVLSISSIQHRKKKNCYFTDFFYFKVSVWKLQIDVEGGRKHLLPRSGCGQNKNLEDVTVDSRRQKPDVLSSIQGLRKLVKADSVCICFVTKHHYTALPWFSFSLF